MMAGEGSSSGTKRKRRRTRVAREQPAADTPLRMVEYRDDGIPHGQSTVLLNSPLLLFAYDTDEYYRLDVIKKLKLLDFRRIDWDLVRQLGQVDRLEQLLGPKFRMALDCDAPQYYELALEFHSTFQYRHLGGFDKPDVVLFILGKKDLQYDTTTVRRGDWVIHTTGG
ncbi:hypothetical protein HanIR_Chr05g0218401 [Helianthus annuus]|nr:hypothetical protein HanIR_Chr05g0218401 [Helianthus annuus]